MHVDKRYINQHGAVIGYDIDGAYANRESAFRLAMFEKPDNLKITNTGQLRLTPGTAKDIRVKTDIRLIKELSGSTSKGVLQKAIYRIDGKTVYVKSNTGRGIEPYTEVLASRIAWAIDAVDHVDYYLMPRRVFGYFDRPLKHVCASDSFAVGNAAIKPFKRYVSDASGKEIYNEFLWDFIHKRFTVEMLQDLYDMLIFDAIIGNMDRHAMNWDYFVFNDGRVKQTPLIDFGASMLNGFNVGGMARLHKTYDEARPFASTHKEQVNMIPKDGIRKKGKSPEFYGAAIKTVLERSVDIQNGITDRLGPKAYMYISKYVLNRVGYAELWI
jgi:hypothetical protein